MLGERGAGGYGSVSPQNRTLPRAVPCLPERAESPQFAVSWAFIRRDFAVLYLNVKVCSLSGIQVGNALII